MNDVDELENPVIVEFPLRGEWVAANTPAKRIPSHGSDMLGQRYAYDFIRTDHRNGLYFCDRGNLRLFLLGVPVSRCYCWGETVHAPFDGVVVVAKDGLRERQRLYPILDILIVIKNSLMFNVNRKLQKILGNHVIMKKDDVYAFFAHLQPDSVVVNEGDMLKAGQVLGKVGHTGNSTAPHLHFQLMDSQDIMTAKGMPCAFRHYEELDNGSWEDVSGGFPAYNRKIRYND